MPFRSWRISVPNYIFIFDLDTSLIIYSLNYFLCFHYYTIIFFVSNSNFTKQKNIYPVKNFSYKNIYKYIVAPLIACGRNQLMRPINIIDRSQKGIP